MFYIIYKIASVVKGIRGILRVERRGKKRLFKGADGFDGKAPARNLFLARLL